MISWIFMGTFLANVFSSAGPCYFNQTVGSFGPYGELFNHLSSINKATPLHSMEAQELLWKVYVGGGIIEGNGISAMPSMHVSIMTTCALGSWFINKAIGVFYIFLTAVFLIGSVYLGWHYAIDGYVSIILTCLIWYLLSKVARIKFGPLQKKTSLDTSN